MIDSAIRPPLSGSGNEIARDETFLEIGDDWKGNRVDMFRLHSRCFAVGHFVWMKSSRIWVEIFDKNFIQSEELIGIENLKKSLQEIVNIW